jgi:hypothetical protein
MFRLNEAPKEALAAISAEKASRGCGLFWSIACCLPSFGGSIGCCDKNNCCCAPRCGEPGGGWIPDAISDDTPVTLDVLIAKLNELRISRDKLQELSSCDTTFDPRKQIEWQVKATIKLLERVCTEGKITGSYLGRLQHTLREIKTRASQEENLGLLIDNEKSPLTAAQPYVPSYGLGGVKK